MNQAERIPNQDRFYPFSPILCHKEAYARMTGCRNHPINENDERYNQRLVKVGDYGIAGENYYHKENNNPPYNHRIPGSICELYVRETVAKQLVCVNRALEKFGLEVFILDGWRPPEIQGYFYYEWMPTFINVAREKKGEKPLKGSALEKEVNRFWAKPNPDNTIDVSSPPAHTTGGAVDVTLREKNSKKPLDMGSNFDEFTLRSQTDYYESRRDLGRNLICQNRRLLYNTMRRFDFESNPNEWWHFCLGDQMWAKMSGAEAAFYSAVDPRR